MERRLHLLRHAKSAWDDPLSSDHDRPLAPRGRRAVKLLARHVADGSIRPQLVLCSTARRTVETLEGVEVGGEHRYEPALYGASATELLARLRGIADHVDEVMVVGHNPALQMLALQLLAGPAGPELESIRAKLPTGALVSLIFTGPWSGLGPAQAQLTGLITPRALADRGRARR